jgi:hypothetical protein
MSDIQTEKRSVMSTADEIVTLVDEHNRVIGAVPRREMRAKRLPHRSTYIFVFNTQGYLYVRVPPASLLDMCQVIR